MSCVCAKCKLDVGVDAMAVTCYGKCQGTYHIQCSGQSLRTYKKRTDGERKKWVCVECRPKKGSNSSVDKNQTDDEEEVVDVKVGKSKLSLDEKIDLILLNQAKTTEELQRNNQLLESYRLEIAELKAELQERDARVEELHQEVRDLQQAAKGKVVEIQHIPKLEDESEDSLIKMAIKTFNAFGVDLQDCEVEGCHRIHFKKSKKKTHGPVVVELSSKRKAQQILKKRKTVVHQSDLVEGESEAQKVYINESLSSFNRELFFECRKHAIAKGYAFVWVKSGRVFVRKHETSEVIKILSLSQLGNL